MKNFRYICNSLTIIFILCFCWPLKFVGSNDVSNQVERRANEMNNIIRNKAERNSDKPDFQLHSFRTESQVRSRQSDSKTDERDTAKSESERLKLNREEMNSSLNKECAQTLETSVVENKQGLQSDAIIKIHSNGHLEDSKMYSKRKRRQKRDPHSVEPSTSTPETIPEGSHESKPEGYPKGSPESYSSETSTTSQPEAYPEQSGPEPEPEWSVAFIEWKDAWPLHTYGFAVVFTLIALMPPFEMLRMYLDKTRLSALKATILSIIFIFGSTRAFILFVDPYGSRKSLPNILNQLLFSIGHPCTISALSLLLLVLIDTTKMNVAPPKFQRVKFIIPIVISHVALVIVTDFVVAFFLEAKVLLLLCQIYFLLLGSLLSVGYICVSWKIRKNIIKSQNTRDNNMKRLQYLITACAVTCVCMCVLTIYAAAGVFGVYSDVKYVDAWPWWAFQTLSRLLEVAICIVMLLMNTRSNKRKILPSLNTTMSFFARRSTVKVEAATRPVDDMNHNSQISVG